MIQDVHVTFMFRNDGVFIACDEALRCGGECQAMHFLFINRSGKSLCLACDARRLMVAASERVAGDDIGAEQSFSKSII